MKKYEKYGTLLTRNEAKEIRGGNGDGPDPLNPDPEVGGSGSNPCFNNEPGCPAKACTLVGQDRPGRCEISLHTGVCMCFIIPVAP